MKIKFWGTRGSLPQAMSHTDIISIVQEILTKAEKQGLKSVDSIRQALTNEQLGQPLSYGGNTSCTEVICGDQFFFVDMGSGLREAGTHYMPSGIKEFHIFLTHMHWDHIMGLPFFVPVHVPGYTVKIYHVHKNAPEHVKINFNGINFPLTFEQLGGQILFEALKLYESKKIGDVAITPFVLDHPGGSFGYRFEYAQKSAAIGVDGEFKRISHKDLGRDLAFYGDLDMLIFDAQYEISELASRFDWGHSSPNIGVDLAVREGIKNLVLTHHDPWSSAEKLRRMLTGAERHLKSQLPSFREEWEKRGQPLGPRILTAYDGLVVDLNAD